MATYGYVTDPTEDKVLEWLQRKAADNGETLTLQQVFRRYVRRTFDGHIELYRTRRASRLETAYEQADAATRQSVDTQLGTIEE